MLEPRSSFVATDAVRLHYLEWNPVASSVAQAEEQWKPDNVETLSAINEQSNDNDAVPLILLHGLGATADTWRLVANHLGQQRQVFAFDLRGHGASEQSADGYDLITVAEDVISGMARLGLGQVALVGHGWGARVALVIASRHQALISHLILIDCPHVEPRHWPGMTRERFIREQMEPEIYVSRARYLQEWQNELDPIWSPMIEEIVMTYVTLLSDGRLVNLLQAEHQRQIRSSLWDDRAVSYYPRLQCPVLLIPAASQPIPGEEPPEHLEQAAEFSAAKGQMAAQVARAIPHCSVYWMAETAHDIQLQRPQLLADIMLAFLHPLKETFADESLTFNTLFLN
ncbi:alpha/beta fold hydrolase [Tengunoibacter tsumagoiensis]|uniref:AB hydrolase-1 domain-containing protein n=1 Tax=Tengunoibacter tsumagoiensis TaxID=2014871 RepID=A0A401ZUL6_9CHLR|nr:alpha/beta hydrolase [Tengunoibacter tsumagoiensis]GCE10615.1 hypothetical protein KTT_04740 [Tengunoibacter tsumagoiensis]